MKNGIGKINFEFWKKYFLEFFWPTILGFRKSQNFGKISILGENFRKISSSENFPGFFNFLGAETKKFLVYDNIYDSRTCFEHTTCPLNRSFFVSASIFLLASFKISPNLTSELWAASHQPSLKVGPSESDILAHRKDIAPIQLLGVETKNVLLYGSFYDNKTYLEYSSGPLQK